MTEPLGPEAVESIVEQAGAPTEDIEVDPQVAVRTLLAMAHLTPPEDEVAGMVEGFVAARTAVRMLYAVPEARYEEPALIFRARV